MPPISARGAPGTCRNHKEIVCRSQARTLSVKLNAFLHGRRDGGTSPPRHSFNSRRPKRPRGRERRLRRPSEGIGGGVGKSPVSGHEWTERFLLGRRLAECSFLFWCRSENSHGSQVASHPIYQTVGV